MIPKKIHYCWFGGNPLPEDVKRYIESWKKYCPDYELIRWDESNYDVHKNTYVELAYQNKKWAFLTDYARLDTIYEHGGIYLDADVELVHLLFFQPNAGYLPVPPDRGFFLCCGSGCRQLSAGRRCWYCGGASFD